MLKRFDVRNYKNFKDTIKIDFSKVGGYHFNQDCLTDDVLGKIIIYGRNATGKTNFGWALMDIFGAFLGVRRLHSPFLNVDSEETTALFRYEFEFDGQSIIYEYRKINEKTLATERLEIGGKLIFQIDFEQKAYKLDGLKYIQAETLVFERYTQLLADSADREGTLPFIRWIFTNTALPNNSILLKLYNFVKGMRMLSVTSQILARPRELEEEFIEYLSAEDHLNDLERFLNAMGVKCSLIILETPEGNKKLYFNNKKPIPFIINASSGTLALYKLYQRITTAMNACSFIYMDEFDPFYNYEMSETVIKYLKSHFPKCQIVLTTHNTNLMTNRLMRPDCLFILSQSGTLTALCNATERELREGHNLEKMYISGEFEKYE